MQITQKTLFNIYPQTIHAVTRNKHEPMIDRTNMSKELTPANNCRRIRLRPNRVTARLRLQASNYDHSPNAAAIDRLISYTVLRSPV